MGVKRMLFLNKDAQPISMLPGLVRRTLAHTKSIMLCEFTFDAHVEIPIHSHPHEQVGYIVKGHVEMTIDGQKFELKMGDSYSSPPNIPHGAFTLEPTIIVDAFYPPREDYK
jgi:quercetin dioxygenase-like cupin family protein